MGRRSGCACHVCASLVSFSLLSHSDSLTLSSNSIIAGRRLAGSYYTFRIDSLTARLKDYQAERAKTIQKLKDATKYDSTLELIEKYGGEQKKDKDAKNAKQATGAQKQQQQQQQQDGSSNSAQQSPANRTRMAPPPTANIQHRAPASPSPLSNAPSPAPVHSPSPLEPGAEFAPNAFAAAASPPPPPSFVQQNANVAGGGESHWYDRIFDVLLGEDETAAKNRIVLLCSACRLVNGQAPPGTTSLADVGVWRCMACHAKNGVENEGKRIVEEVLAGEGGDVAGDDDEDSEDAKVEEHDIPEAKGDGEVSASGMDGPAAGVKKRRAKKGN